MKLFDRLRRKSMPVTVTATPALTEMLRLYDGSFSDPDKVYRDVPGVQSVIDAIAANGSQVRMKVYRKKADGDRVELQPTQHPLASTLANPNPDTSESRFMDALWHDWLIHDNAFALIQGDFGGDITLVRLPPASVNPPANFGFGRPTSYRVGNEEIPANRVLHIVGFDPQRPHWGYSRLLTLKNAIAEEVAASRHRRGFWKNSGRYEGVVQRPVDAPEWSPEARNRFREDFRNAYSGDQNAGRTLVLEEGMTLAQAGFSPKDAEFIPGREFVIQTVCRSFNYPESMLGLGERAAYASQREFHKALYTDTLGPIFRRFQDEILLQLAPWFADMAGVYLEFNVAEKLRGDFEETSDQLSTATGTAWMTVNEARQRLNMPHIEGGDELIRPMNLDSATAPTAGDQPPVPPE